MSVVRYELSDMARAWPLPACWAKERMTWGKAERRAEDMRSRGRTVHAYYCRRCRASHVGSILKKPH